jgi:hypothetical protein
LPQARPETPTASELRDALRWALIAVGSIVDSRGGVKERVRRLNRFRDVLEPIAWGARREDKAAR